MNVDQVYAILRDGEQDPREALQWALDHWDQASDRLLSKLRALFAKMPDDPESGAFDDGDVDAILALLHLFAEKRDTRAYGPLCQRLMRDKDATTWLGDTVLTTLSQVLISLYDGDISPIAEIVERAEGDELVAAAALEAYAYLVRKSQAATDDEARALLMRLAQRAEADALSDFWFVWADAVARLGFSDFAPEVARMLTKGAIDGETYSLQEFHRVIGLARSDIDEAFAEVDIGPFESVVALFEPQEDEFEDELPQTPHVNPMRDVGRNDPCPCGSGKKYKKCCMAA